MKAGQYCRRFFFINCKIWFNYAALLCGTQKKILKNAFMFSWPLFQLTLIMMVKKIRKFLVISSFMFQRKKKVIQVCNDMKELKFLHELFYAPIVCFKITVLLPCVFFTLILVSMSLFIPPGSENCVWRSCKSYLTAGMNACSLCCYKRECEPIHVCPTEECSFTTSFEWCWAIAGCDLFMQESGYNVSYVPE